MKAKIEKIAREKDLFRMDGDGMIRVPILLKGVLRAPAQMSRAEAERAFSAQGADGTWARAGGNLVLREPVYHRASLERSGAFAYTVLPDFRPEEVIEADPVAVLAERLAPMPFSGVVEWLDGVRKALDKAAGFVDAVRRDTAGMSEHPDMWHDGGFAAFPFLLDSEAARKMVDRELSSWGIPGTGLLEGWQPLPEPAPAADPAPLMAAALFPDEPFFRETRAPKIRAFPTRQLHITAGNAPQVPLISLLRAVLTKSAAVLKAPFGAVVPAALLGMAAAVALPDHPITKSLSIVYWPGGEPSYEDALLSPGSFDRIVVWGAPEAVESVKKKALYTKVLAFNPRYGVSFLGREALQNLETAAARAATDSLVANQKACIASQIHYVEGSMEEAASYAEALKKALSAFDAAAPNLILPAVRGNLKRLMRGLFVNARWFINERDGFFTSGAVLPDGEFPLSALTMSRLVMVRAVPDLTLALKYLHPGVSTVGVYPPERLEIMADSIAARGVSNVVDLGRAGSGFGGQPHDGMMVLSELVDWKNR